MATAHPVLQAAAGRRGPTPADLVTLGRAVLVVGLAALVLRALSLEVQAQTWTVVWVGALAWALDGVDGYVARRTGTVTDHGAVLDSGVDGALVLVLAVALAPVAPWALIGGLLYPAFLLGQVWRPAWRRMLPHRTARRLAGGTLTGTLVVGAAPFWSAGTVRACVALAITWVVWSFAVDVRWLERT